MTYDDDEYVDPEPFIRNRARTTVVRAPRGPKAELTPRQRAKRRVKTPATILLLTAVLGFLIGLFVLLVNIMANDANDSLVPSIIGGFIILWHWIIIYGAFEMDRFGSYTMSRIAAWMAIIPFPLPTYPVFLITGIVALYALNNAEVQHEFLTKNN